MEKNKEGENLYRSLLTHLSNNQNWVAIDELGIGYSSRIYKICQSGKPNNCRALKAITI